MPLWDLCGAGPRPAAASQAAFPGSVLTIGVAAQVSCPSDSMRTFLTSTTAGSPKARFGILKPGCCPFSATADPSAACPSPVRFLIISRLRMKLSVQISRGIESLFGTRDENIRLLESGLAVEIRLLTEALEIDGEEPSVIRAASILEDYFALVKEGQAFASGDLTSYLRVVSQDAEVTLRSLVHSGRQRNFGKKVLAPKTVNQRRYVEAIERHDLVFGVGPAGTGKTYLAVAMAVSALLSKRVSRIVLTRPAVEAGEKLGFLPGNLQEKIDPYLRPLYDALYDMLEGDKVEKLLERQTIEVAPIAFMRGRTLNDSFIIFDEAQNSTAEQMKMVLTRLGFNSKMVVNGDLTQVDLPPGRRSGLGDALEVLRGSEGVSFVHFDDRDVVRHTLVQRIVKAYERHHELTTGKQLAFKLAPDPPPESPAPEAPPPDMPRA